MAYNTPAVSMLQLIKKIYYVYFVNWPATFVGEKLINGIGHWSGRIYGFLIANMSQKTDQWLFKAYFYKELCVVSRFWCWISYTCKKSKSLEKLVRSLAYVSNDFLHTVSQICLNRVRRQFVKELTVLSVKRKQTFNTAKPLQHSLQVFAFLRDVGDFLIDIICYDIFDLVC
jgi:hypothetical protein